MNADEINALSKKIIGAAIEVHTILGPGLLEKAYQEALYEELKLRGLSVKREVEIPLTYKGVEIGEAFRADIIVEDEIILELKSTENDNPVYYKQLLTYLRLSGKRLGFLINFSRETLKEGLKRVANGI